MKCKRIIIAAIIFLFASMVFNSSSAEADIHVYDKNSQYLGILIGMDFGDPIDLFIPSLGATFKYSADYSGWCGDGS